jgi:hypothetical protein
LKQEKIFDIFLFGYPIDFNEEKVLAYVWQKNYIIHPELKRTGCPGKGAVFEGQGVQPIYDKKDN